MQASARTREPRGDRGRRYLKQSNEGDAEQAPIPPESLQDTHEDETVTRTKPFLSALPFPLFTCETFGPFGRELNSRRRIVAKNTAVRRFDIVEIAVYLDQGDTVSTDENWKK